LFSLASVQFAILNRDDTHYADFLVAAKGKEIINFGLDDFDDIRPTEQGFLVTLQHHIFEVPFLAKFNLLNVLSAFNTLKTFGFKPEKIIPLLHKLKPPLGRMQKINNHLIWIDYAHTPDAIENAICTLQQHYPTHDIRVVFGCLG
jgi:UDP-N-acetylmuramoyl-L-alanyl-D-glutamate--2,6-diaminopimelate ligase